MERDELLARIRERKAELDDVLATIPQSRMEAPGAVGGLQLYLASAPLQLLHVVAAQPEVENDDPVSHREMPAQRGDRTCLAVVR